MKTRRHWIGSNEPIPITRQCALAGTNRSTFCQKANVFRMDAEEKVLLDLIESTSGIHSKAITDCRNLMGFLGLKILKDYAQILVLRNQ